MNNVKTSAPARAAEPVAPRPPRLVEVELLRKYVPEGQTQEIKVPVVGVVSLPESEAGRVLKLGIARATDNTFG